MNATELTAALAHFTGSEEYTRHGLARNVLMTQGVVFLAEQAQAHWLTDLIVSYLTKPEVRAEPFQTWRLSTQLEKASAVASMTDGNSDRAIVRQEIEHTDFPLAEIVFYLVQQEQDWILLLATEY